jgi:hypothetical protein
LRLKKRSAALRNQGVTLHPAAVFRTNCWQSGSWPETGFAEIIDDVLEADFPFNNFREPNRQYMFKHSVESRMLYPNFAVT